MAGRHHDLSCASATGLYDITARRWDPEALRLAGIDAEQLATVVPTTHVVTGCARRWLRKRGLPRDLPVVVGASDGPLANGLGARGIAAVSLGTSGALRAVRPAPAVDEAARLFCYALTDDHWVLGGAINNAGSVVRWASAALGMVTADVHGEDRDAADARPMHEAGQVPFGSEGLLCLPYLIASGLRGGSRGCRVHGSGYADITPEATWSARPSRESACSWPWCDWHWTPPTYGCVKYAQLAERWNHRCGARCWPQLSICRSGLAASPEGAGTGAGLLGHHALASLPDLDSAADLIDVDRGKSPNPDDVAMLRGLLPLMERCTVELKPVFAELAQ